eukprot:gene2148-2467_t
MGPGASTLPSQAIIDSTLPRLCDKDGSPRTFYFGVSKGEAVLWEAKVRVYVIRGYGRQSVEGLGGDHQLQRVLTYQRWSGEYPYLSRFLACFTAMVGELLRHGVDQLNILQPL